MKSYLQSRPLYGSNVSRRSEPKFLFVACFDPHGIGTVGEHIACWQSCSRFDFHLLNLWPNNSGGALAIPETVDLNSYDGVVLHNTTAYFPANLFNLDSRLQLKFRDYTGVKVLVKQDEHYHSARWAEFIRDNDFNVLITCVPPAEREKIYPRSIVGDIPVIHALTGFVSPTLRTLDSPSFEDRTTDISYRGSVQPLSFGRLGFEKRKIGYDVAKAMSASGRQIDVSSRWEDRITGENWLQFLTNSKVTLGVESGSNLFDFDGSVESWCKDYEKQNQNVASDSDEFYLNAHNLFLHKYEGNVSYGQVSPRHFEAAAARSVQLLYEGDYSGIFIPDRHYVPLKRDLSNLENALEVLNNPARAKQLTDAAFDEIIMNDDFSYARFVRAVDEVLEREVSRRTFGRQAELPFAEQANAPPSTAASGGRQRALVLMAHEPSVDPRIDWFCTGLSKMGLDITELGIRDISRNRPAVEDLGEGRIRARVDRTSHANDGVSNPIKFARDNVSFPEHVLLMLGAYAKMDQPTLAERIGAYETEESVDLFTWYCGYFYDVNSSLLRAAREIGAHDVIVAVDLDTLPAALILAKETNAVCVYDSHEYWKGNVITSPWAFEFWANIERPLVQLVDICCTVSPPLASQLQLEYGKSFVAVPNCELSSAERAVGRKFVDRSNLKEESVVFLYQGNFHPERPIGKLIEAWRHTDENAILWLRGPQWAHRDELIELASSTGLLGTRIFFPERVTEAELVSAAAEADVGIIPYDPAVHFGYRFACPNKLSQYLAAGLAILTTDLEYVKTVVTENELGRVFNLGETASLVREVNTLTQDRALRRRSAEAGREYFVTKFNWEAVSGIAYDQIAAALEKREERGRRDLSMRRFDRILVKEPPPPEPPPPPVEPDPVPLADTVEAGQPLVVAMLASICRPFWRLFPAAIRVRIRNNLLRLILGS